MKNLYLFIAILLSLKLFSKQAEIKGFVYDAYSNEPIEAAAVGIPSLGIGTTSNSEGFFQLKDIKPGEYSIFVQVLGYKPQVQYEVRLIAARSVNLDFRLEKTSYEIEEVQVKARPKTRSAESPVSLKSISATEIYRNPGGNRDISRVIQALPGVGTVASFRNDIFVRGGSPGENKFFLDGIEVPNINHFATQGSSGGPVGMINVDFIREVNFYSGAFPSNRGNSLSSIIEFKQKEGNSDQINTTLSIGSSDYGVSFEGPMGESSNFIFSARRSYLQFLFKALKLPFLPIYNDFQYKHTFKIDQKNKLTIIGLAAIDENDINESVNEDVDDEEKLAKNEFILNSIPKNDQNSYTIGAKWQHFFKSSYENYIISRSYLHNKAIKYRNNEEKVENLFLDYDSKEIEHKFRFEHHTLMDDIKFNFGFGIEHADFSINNFVKKVINSQSQTIQFDSEFELIKYAIFGTASRKFLNEKLELSLGIRTDFNNYSSDMSNPIEQISPRFSASYNLTQEWSLNSNIGIFYQLPAYTVMGFRNSKGELVNKNNGLKFINATHYVLGSEYNFNKYFNISMEGFYKKYDNYPYLIDQGISLANLGADFGVIGNDNINSESEGRAYGLEFIVQQRLSNSVYGILSYTFVKSEFTNANNKFSSSSWDNRHILNITAGKKFDNLWEVGLKFRLAGGAPYTPYDYQASAKKTNWDATQVPVLDYSKINSERLDFSHGMDIRIDKKWIVKDIAIGLYLDIQNLYNQKIKGVSNLIADLDENGQPISENDDYYKMREIENFTGTILPSIGLIIEF